MLTMGPDATADYPYRNVLVPTDGSDSAGVALERGVEVANAAEATLHLLSVVDIANLGIDVRADVQTAGLEEGAREIVDDAAAVAEREGVASVSRAVEHASSVHKAVLSYVDEHDVDLVVVGTNGRSGLDRYLLGSVTEALVRTCPVPVLTVRGPAAGG